MICLLLLFLLPNQLESGKTALILLALEFLRTLPVVYLYCINESGHETNCHFQFAFMLVLVRLPLKAPIRKLMSLFS